MKTRYKISLVVLCIFAAWVLFPNITGMLCYFVSSYDANTFDRFVESGICSIVGINFFGHPLETNLFNENVRGKIYEDFQELGDDKR